MKRIFNYCCYGDIAYIVVAKFAAAKAKGCGFEGEPYGFSLNEIKKDKNCKRIDEFWLKKILPSICTVRKDGEEIKIEQIDSNHWDKYKFVIKSDEFMKLATLKSIKWAVVGLIVTIIVTILLSFVKDNNIVENPVNIVQVDIGQNSGMTVTCPEKYAVGPFVTGKANELEDDKILKVEVQLLVNKLTADSVFGKLLWLILIGSADRKPLTSALSRIYGSNSGLAQARALKVKNLLKQQFNAKVPAMLVLSTGPSKTINTVVSSKDTEEHVLASDRSVYLCALFKDET